LTKKAIEIQEQKASLENALDDEIKEYDKVKDLHQDLQNTEEEGDALASKKLQIQRKIRSLAESIKTAEDTTLPNLNNEKEIAAKKHRNFKAAKALQEEIRILKENIEAQQKEKEEAEKLLKESSDEFDRKQTEKVALEQHVKDKEKEIDMAQMEKIKHRITDLRIGLRTLQTVTTSPAEIKRQEMLLDIERAKLQHVHGKYGMTIPPEPALPPVQAKQEPAPPPKEESPVVQSRVSQDNNHHNTESDMPANGNAHENGNTTSTSTTDQNEEDGAGSGFSFISDAENTQNGSDHSLNQQEGHAESNGETVQSEVKSEPLVPEEDRKKQLLETKTNQLEQLQSEINELDSLVAVAADSGDYDKAEELDGTLQDKKNQVETLQSEIASLTV